MHAPHFVTEGLYRLHKDARLAWLGQDRSGPEDDLNQGKFALVQLYHWKDAQETFYGDPWGDRGPIFGRPFDRLQRVPIMLTILDPKHVMTGALLCACRGCIRSPDQCFRCGHRHEGVVFRRWIMSIRDRVMAGARERGAQYQTEIDDLAEETGDYIHWRSQRSTFRPNVVPQKDLTAEDKAVLSGDAIKGVKDTFVDKLQTGGDPLR